MTIEAVATPRSQYVEFWNNVLVPKFVRWRHILVDGLTLHSAKVFPSLAVKPGDKVVDAGCGFGDTAIQLARLIGPTGSVLAVDSMPSALAVLRLITSSYLVGACTGRSAGFSPLRIRST